LTESGATARDEESTRQVVSAAARAVGSLSDSEFDVSFNPDVFQDHVKHAQPEVVLLLMYTVGRKKRTTLFWIITSVFLDEFLHFLYQWKQE